MEICFNCGGIGFIDRDINLICNFCEGSRRGRLLSLDQNLQNQTCEFCFGSGKVKKTIRVKCGVCDKKNKKLGIILNNSHFKNNDLSPLTELFNFKEKKIELELNDMVKKDDIKNKILLLRNKIEYFKIEKKKNIEKLNLTKSVSKKKEWEKENRIFDEKIRTYQVALDKKRQELIEEFNETDVIFEDLETDYEFNVRQDEKKRDTTRLFLLVVMIILFGILIKNCG